MSMSRQGLFREQALKKKSSPEQLDEMIQITSSTGWLALLALALLVVVTILWGFFGSIASTTTGTGVFVRGGVINSAVAPVAGEVREINVGVGDKVTQGQRVARVGTVTVISPYAGRVMQVLTDKGSFVSSGDAILSLEATDQPMQMIGYVALADAKKVKPGMKVQVSPSTVKKEEFGSIVASVDSVAEFPSTTQSLRGVLVNEELIKTVLTITAPVECRIRLERSPDTVSGYKWSSSGGPPIEIAGGTLGYLTVAVSEQAPITMVLPWFKSLLE